MWKLNIAILAGVIAAVVLVSKAWSAPTDNCAASVNVIGFNADYGLKPYLLGVGSTWWKGKGRLAATTTLPGAPFCDASAKAAFAVQQRFYVLLRAFPSNPTRAQWQSRYVPLIQSAIAADTLFAQVMRGSGVVSRNITFDLAWLHKMAHLPYGSTPE